MMRCEVPDGTAEAVCETRACIISLARAMPKMPFYAPFKVIQQQLSFHQSLAPAGSGFAAQP